MRVAPPVSMSRGWSLLFIAVAIRCAPPDSKDGVHRLECTLGTAVPAAFVSAVAMSVLGGRTSPCATVVTPPGAAGHSSRPGLPNALRRRKKRHVGGDRDVDAPACHFCVGFHSG